jgi:16S rRNA (cytosine1402-N4)-methyltransferase
MRYDTRQALTAAEIVNMWSVDDLARIFRRYGEEPKAGLFAKAIVSARQSQSLTSTLQLADVIAAHQPRRGRLHPATKVFQALRVAVNDELGEVTKGLQALATTLKPGGRVAVITFHSLEDRLVKDFFKQAEGFTSLTKKPIVATAEEVGNNPRARSAKLRLAQKL